MARALILTSGGDADPPYCREPYATGRLEAAELFALDEAGLAAGLAPYAAVFLPIHVDQRRLAARRPVLEAWLDAGGTLVVNGHVAYPFLAGLDPFVPIERPRAADFEVVAIAPHPVFAGIDRAHLTRRKGVAGFYGRGHNPPPPGAVPLNGLATPAIPVDWEWRRPGGGRVFMHAGNNIWMYLGADDSAARLPRQLLDWALDAPA